MRRMRATAWIACSAAFVVFGFACLIGALVAASAALRGELVLSAPQAVALRIAFGGIVLGGLLPQLLGAGVTWLVVMRLAPACERSWSRICAVAVATSAAWFPIVAATAFGIWSPETPADYWNTLALMSGGVAAALLAPRRLIRAFGPGAFGAVRS